LKLVTVNELAELCSRQRSTIKKRIAQLPVEKRGKSVLFQSDAALESIYDADRAKIAEATSSDRARRERALADLAELQLGKELGTLGRLSEIENIWADAIERGISGIEKLKSLTTEQKEAVFRVLRSTVIKGTTTDV
jgi:hypothetical protein